MDQRRLALPHLCLRMLTYDTGTVLRTTGLLLIAGSLLFACSWQGSQERMSDATMVRKSESAHERSVQDPAAQSLIDDLKKRTAILFTNTDEVVVEVLEGQRRRIKWRSNGMIDISAAIPVAKDGYFLTTAHSVEAPTSLTLVAWIEDVDFRGPRAAPARIVWTADKMQRPDIAVLHAELSPLVPFTMAGVPAVEDSVAATGAANWVRMAKRWDNESGLGEFSTISFGRALGAGRTINERRHPPYRLIRHTAPTTHGDSGGALVNQRGELIGINSTVHAPWWLGWLPHIGVRVNLLMGGVGSSSQAVRLDFDWLTDLIATDRQRQTASR